MLNINKIIIWGLRDSGHTHSFIHAGFFKAFKHMGYETYWLNSVDEAIKHKVDTHNAFYLFVDLIGQPHGPFPLPPLHSSCFYFGHHVVEKQKQSILEVVPIENVLWFGISTLICKETYHTSGLYDYNAEHNALFLNWATDLLPHEIQRNIELLDTVPASEPTIFHVGSMSNGWAAPYVEFMKHMQEYGVGFRHFGPGSQFGLVSDEQNQTLIKQSFAAPALQFKWQVDVEYIPCRIFKNISYGKMGITNNPGVHRLFGEKTLYSSDLKELAKMTYEFEKNPKKNDVIKELMTMVKEKHTYVSRIEFILNEVKKNKNVQIQKKLENNMINNMISFTVCIPCVDKHIERMEKLLHSFEHYVIKPDKVVASLSPRYLCLDLTEEKKRLEKIFPFLTCIVQDKITHVGDNVNATFEHVETDYTVIWGADDFFHPQYFEIMNYVIKKYNPNVIGHFWDDELTKRVHFNPELAYNFDVFDKIELDNMIVYNDLYLIYVRDHKGEIIMRICEKNRGFLPNLSYGMQTLKTHIIKENKFKVGPEYDYRSDTLFITEMAKKYGNACVVAENLVEYMPSWTYSIKPAWCI